MKIQTCSIDVPGECQNKCSYCVSHIHGCSVKDIYSDQLKRDIAITAMTDRLKYVERQGVDTIIFTGFGSDPALNTEFMTLFYNVNRSLGFPFVNLEVQTSGVGLTDEVLDLFYSIGIKTISLSISSLNSALNAKINNTKELWEVNLRELPGKIKEQFNLRISLNINKIGFADYNFPENDPTLGFDGYFEHFTKLFDDVKAFYDPDQITVRKLWFSEEDNSVNNWIKENVMNDSREMRVRRGPMMPLKNLTFTWFEMLGEYLQDERFAHPVLRLPYGAIKYSLNEMSVVADTDSMGQEDIENIKFFVYKRNGKLYSKWNDHASLIF